MKGGVEMFMCTHLSSCSLPGSLAETDGKRNIGHQFHPLVCASFAVNEPMVELP